MKDKSLTITFIVSLILFGLLGMGAFFPSAFNWGFHFLGFLPLAYSFTYLLPGIILVLFLTFLKKGALFKIIGAFSEKKPLLVLLSLISLFLIAAFTFRIQVPLLGDSYVITNIIENALTGKQALRLYSEPLSILFFYSISKMFGAVQTAQIQEVFFSTEVLLGIGYCFFIYFTGRTLFTRGIHQLLFTGFLLSLPSLQLFFGYIEWYPVVLFCLSLFMFAVSLYLRKNIPFYFIILSYALLIGSHYVNGLFLPALLYLGYLELKKKGFVNIGIGLGILGLLAVIMFWGLNVDPSSFFTRKEGIPLLSLSPGSNGYSAYSLFSFFHALDIANLFILLGSFTLLIIGFTLSKGWKRLLTETEGKLFLFFALPLLLFIFFIRFDLGMARDWDIPATFLLPVHLFALYFFLNSGFANANKIVGIAIVSMVFLSTPFYHLNSTTNPNIARLKSLFHSSMMSQEAYYSAASHLSKHYFLNKDLPDLTTLWETYLSSYPTDWRGYRALTNSTIQLSGINKNERIMKLFTLWIAVDTLKQTMRNEYLDYCTNMSKMYFRKGLVDSSIAYGLKTVEFDSTSPSLFNNLGIIYRAAENNSSASECYKKAILLDSSYIPSYINLGNANDDMGKTEEALYWYHAALRQDSTNTSIYENIAIVYYKTADTLKYLDALSHAARYGSADAQQFLRRMGIQW